MPLQNTARPVVDASLAPIQPLVTHAGQDRQIIAEGWVLKKRRKKMQGTLTRQVATYHFLNAEE